MPYKIVNKNDIIAEYDSFCKTKRINVNIDSNHKRIRDFFLNTYYELKNKYNKSYKLDLELGIKFFEFMNNEKDFDHIYCSDFSFWRYVAVFDIPDIVEDRFGINSKDHFYKRTTRIYPYVLYWYINLSWQGDVDSTRLILEKNTTDEIMQIVDRTGKIGINLELFRLIMKEYSLPEYDEIKSKILLEARKKGKTNSYLRMIMTKNTNKLLVFRPELYDGGIQSYVSMLFEI